jgi:hypothetical protein
MHLMNERWTRVLLVMCYWSSFAGIRKDLSIIHCHATFTQLLSCDERHKTKLPASHYY